MQAELSFRSAHMSEGTCSHVAAFILFYFILAFSDNYVSSVSLFDAPDCPTVRGSLHDFRMCQSL